MLEKTLESPLGCKEIKPVSPKGNQSWIFIGRTDPETEAPVLWSPDVKSWLIWKDLIVGKDWKQQEKGTAEDVKMDSITDSVDMNLSKLRETVKDRGAWCTAVHGMQRVELDSDWAATTIRFVPAIVYLIKVIFSKWIESKINCSISYSSFVFCMPSQVVSSSLQLYGP